MNINSETWHMALILKKLKRLRSALVAARLAYKHGGFSTFRIGQVNYSAILQGKNILITGGGSGIGLAIAEKCLSLGAKVVITGRNRIKLDDAISKISSPNLIGLVWDISDVSVDDVKLAECRDMLGGDIDILVNSAGVIDTTEFLLVNEEQWDKIYATNSKGVFFLAQAICRYWVTTGARNKKILNISSQAGFVGATYPYRMSKWDIEGLTKGLGLKFCDKGIIVNGVAPGIVATAMQPNLVERDDNIYCPHNPMKRFALPLEIAELCVFLISDASNFIVGQTIICDGGYSLK